MAHKRLSIPKFHDKVSLYTGAFAGLVMAVGSALQLVVHFRSFQIFTLLVGIVLCVHCCDMVKYYRKHRILKIVKTDNLREIHKADEVKEGNKIKVFIDALEVAWMQTSFKVWLALCTLGIVLGIVAGVGMTNLVLLVAIACMGWAMEMANVGMESFLDMVHPSYHNKIKVLKDSFAGATIFLYSAYVISWLILVAPSLYLKVVG
ncbi:MAG: diacylglycerol kinase [Thiotrichaceae bacterium]